MKVWIASREVHYEHTETIGAHVTRDGAKDLCEQYESRQPDPDVITWGEATHDDAAVEGDLTHQHHLSYWAKPVELVGLADQAAATAALVAIAGAGDGEELHSEADSIVLAAAHPDVAAAYRQVKDAADFWAFA